MLLKLYNLRSYNNLLKVLFILLVCGFNINSSFGNGNITGKNSYTRFHSPENNNCQVCHITKESKQIIRDRPRWVKKATETNYLVYSSETLDANVSQPLGSSKLCLSCHDGTLALDNLGIHDLTSAQDFGTDLRNSHPVSFKYDSYLASKDAGLHDPVSSPSGLGGTIDSDMLVDGNLECISCHDIHGFTKIKHYLIKPNFKSRLCLTCHDK